MKLNQYKHEIKEKTNTNTNKIRLNIFFFESLIFFLDLAQQKSFDSFVPLIDQLTSRAVFILKRLTGNYFLSIFKVLIFFFFPC